MKNKEKLLALAYDIKRDFDTIMVAEIPLYQQGWRYKELLEMTEEIRTDQMKPHPIFDHWTSMASDELMSHEKIWDKVHALKRAFDASV